MLYSFVDRLNQLRVRSDRCLVVRARVSELSERFLEGGGQLGVGASCGKDLCLICCPFHVLCIGSLENTTNAYIQYDVS